MSQPRTLRTISEEPSASNASVAYSSNVLSNSLAGGDGAFPFIFEQPPGTKITQGTQTATFFLHLLLAVCLFALFVTFLFFVITTAVEQNTVSKNINRVVNELTVDLTATLTETEKAQIELLLNQHLQPPDLSAQDQEVADSNRQLVHQSLIVVFSVFGAALFVILLTWGLMRLFAKKRDSNAAAGVQYPDLKHIVVENFILLAFVAGTELLFLLGIGGNYESIDSNTIRRSIYQTTLDFINS